ncbi:hypothetical protein KR067_006081 [Drosophila pandora]|nr:hypothetical protein KR067_006081 [Drosophila pandora]
MEPTTCETPKVDLVEATQNKENTTSTPASHQKLLKLCGRSDVVITSFSPRETGVKIEKSFTCVRKPALATTPTVSTPKSAYSTPKGVLSELNDDSCSRDLMDFSTPSTSQKGKRESSMYLIDLTTPSKLRPTTNAKQLPTPISVDSTDESSDGSPMVIDITNSATPPSPTVTQAKQDHQTPRRLVAGTPKRTPQSLMKRALLTSTKKQIAEKQNGPGAKGSPSAAATPTPKRMSLLEARRQCLTTPRRLPFHPHRQTPVHHRSGSHESDRNKPPKTSPRKKHSQNLSTPRENKLSQLRKSLAASKRSPAVDKSNMLVAKACRSLNSPKGGSPKPGSPKPESPVNRLTFNTSQRKCSTPEKNDDSTSELSRTFTVLDDNQGEEKDKAISVVEAVAAIVSGELEVSFQIEDNVRALEKSLQLPLKSVETKTSSVATDFESEEKERATKAEPAEENMPSVSVDATKEQESPIDAVPVAESQPSKALEDQCVEDPEENPEIAPVIEESICEEVHADIPEKSHDEAEKTVEVIDDIICEEVPAEKVVGEEEVSQRRNEETPTAQTPVTRRSSRRLSVDQRAVATTPRRSTRRASMEASKKAETDTTKKLKRRASYSAVERQEVTTPRRKRRTSEDQSTPTRQSMRLLNTPKKTLAVDESVGDMGIIVEETSHDEGEISAVADDEEYGNELPGDEVDKVDYHGLRDLLKTPKSCSTPRFKGLREMMQTPKAPASPILDNIEEMLESSAGSTPHHKSSSVSVAHVTIEGGKLLDRVLKTPSARNIMVPNDPASAVLKSRTDSVAAPTTEYNLSMGNATLHLDKIFDDVARSADDTEVEINVTTVSTVADPLGATKQDDTISSEALMSVCTTSNKSVRKDPLTSTTYKGALQADQHLGTKTDYRPVSPDVGEMSGIQLLDQTSDSMFSEPLMVSAVDSCDITVEETKADVPINPVEGHAEDTHDRSDTDSNVGLTEPLVLSDDDEEGSGSHATPKKSKDQSAAEKHSDTFEGQSIEYTLEESIAPEVSKKDNDKAVSTGESIAEALEKLEESQIEISLIEAEESAAESIENGTKLTDKSLVIELDDSSDTEAPPKATNESATVDLTILESEAVQLEEASVVESEVYYLDSTVESRTENQSKNVDFTVDISNSTDVLANDTLEEVSILTSKEEDAEPSENPTESNSQLKPDTVEDAVQKVQVEDEPIPDVSSESKSSPEKAKKLVAEASDTSTCIEQPSLSEQIPDDNQAVSFELPAEGVKPDASVLQESITLEDVETGPITIEENSPSTDKEIVLDSAKDEHKEEVAGEDGPPKSTANGNEESPLASQTESESTAQQTKENETENVSADLTVGACTAVVKDASEESLVADKSAKDAVGSGNGANEIQIPSLDEPAGQNHSEESNKADASDEKTGNPETEIQSMDESHASRVLEETTTSVGYSEDADTACGINSAEVETSANNDSDICFVDDSLCQADATSSDVENSDEKTEENETPLCTDSLLESTDVASFTDKDTSIQSLDRSLPQIPEDKTAINAKESLETAEGADEAASSQVASSPNNELEVLPAAEPPSQAQKTEDSEDAEDSIAKAESDTQSMVDISSASDGKTSADIIENVLEDSLLVDSTHESDNVQVNSVQETESSLPVQEQLVEDAADNEESIAELTRESLPPASLETTEVDNCVDPEEKSEDPPTKENSDASPATEVISAEEVETPASQESLSDTTKDAKPIEEANDVSFAEVSTTERNLELEEESVLEDAAEEVPEISQPEELDAPSKDVSQPCIDITDDTDILDDADAESTKPTEVKEVTEEVTLDTETPSNTCEELKPNHAEDVPSTESIRDIDITDDTEIQNKKPTSDEEVSEKQEDGLETETGPSNTPKELETSQPEELDAPSTESTADQSCIEITDDTESLNNDLETTKPTAACEENVTEDKVTCLQDALKESVSDQPEVLNSSSTKSHQPCIDTIDDTESPHNVDSESITPAQANEDTEEAASETDTCPDKALKEPAELVAPSAKADQSCIDITDDTDTESTEPTRATEVTEEQEVTSEAETRPSKSPNQPESCIDITDDKENLNNVDSEKLPGVCDEGVTKEQEVTIPAESSSAAQVQAPESSSIVPELAYNISLTESHETEKEKQNDSIIIEDDRLPDEEACEKLAENSLRQVEDPPLAAITEPNPVIEIDDSSSSQQEFVQTAVDVNADKPEEVSADELKSSSNQPDTNIPDLDIPTVQESAIEDLPVDDNISQESESSEKEIIPPATPMEEDQDKHSQTLDVHSELETVVDLPVNRLDIDHPKEGTAATDSNIVTISSDDESEDSPKEANQTPSKEEEATPKLTNIETPIETAEDPTPEAEAVGHSIPKPSVDEEEAPKEEKPVKRTTRKGSAHADQPNEAIDLTRTKRRARKPSAEVVEESNDHKQEETVPENSRRRLRKPSKEVEENKHEDVSKSTKGKPKLRGRTPSSEIAEEVEHIPEHKAADDLPPIVEEALECSTINEPQTPIEKGNSDEKSEELISSEESLQTIAEEVAPKNDAGADHAGDLEEPTKRRGRKPSADVASSTSKDPAKDAATDNSETHKAEQELPSIQEAPESLDHAEKPKRRGRKPSNNVVHADVEKPRRRGRTPADTDEPAEKKPRRNLRKASSEPTDSNVLPENEPLESVDEKDVPPQEELKPMADAEASSETKEESATPTGPQDALPLPEKEELRPRRRGRKPTAESAEIPTKTELIKSVVDEKAGTASEPEQEATKQLPEKEEHKIRRRGRKPTAETVELTSKEEPNLVQEASKPLAEEAEHKPRRRGRKPTVEPEDMSTKKDLVHSGAADKSAASETEPEPVMTVPEEEPKTRRRGRKATAETVEIAATTEAINVEPAPVVTARRRGRKVTEDDDHSSVESKPKRRARNASVEEVKHDVPVNLQVEATPVVEVASEVLEKKPARRARKASTNVDEATPVKKTTARRARKADATHEDELEKRINLHDLPTEHAEAVVVTGASLEKNAQEPASSGEVAEEEITPRRREGRNLPRKNYDETSDEDKPSSSLRRARKPAVSKAQVAEAPSVSPQKIEAPAVSPQKITPPPVTPQKIEAPVEEAATPINTVAPPEPTTSQRREGRNLPRKNYAEAPDEDKPSSRSRRVRNPTVKALELIVSSSPRPATPKKRKGKAAEVEEPQEKKTAQEAPEPQAATEPEPVVPPAKARGGRRKADEAPVVEAPETEAETKPAKKNSRATARKAKVEAPAEEQQPPTKKSRVAARAKTPVPSSEDVTTDPEEPVKKPAARSRARGGAKAAAAAVAVAVVEEPHPPAQESESEAPAPTAARSGRARKVHFEAIITPEEASSSEAAPKRTTRSRRK